MEEGDIDFLNVDIICHTCLSRNRKTFPLGEYCDIYEKIMSCNLMIDHDLKVCWECLGVLKRIKIFETKCIIAQNLLRTNWANKRAPTPLSSLSLAPIRINDVTLNEEQIYVIKETNHEFEESYSDKEDSFEHDDYDYKEDSDQSVEMDEKSDEIKNCDVKTEVTKDNTNCNTVEDSGESKVNVSDISIKRNDKTNNTSQIPLIDFNDETQRGFRRKRLVKKDWQEHYKIVGIKQSDLKSFKIKIKIDAKELEMWREQERASEVFQAKPFKCNDCIFGFISLKKKLEHDNKYHDEYGKFTCDICDVRYPTKPILAAHIAKHYFIYKCLVCGLRYASRRAIKKHLKKHKRALRCAHCAACFPNMATFTKHFKANHSVFICDHCGKKCRTKYTLEKHMRHHFEPNVCLICNKVYASRNSLRNHSDMKHKRTRDELAYCVQCDKQFASAALYKRHVTASAAHAAERDADRGRKQISCPICGNMYSRKTYMMNHYRHVHMKQSKHYCADCDRHFLNRTRYVEHRKYHHEGEIKVKDKVCNICGRGFAANRTLLNHIRTHSGERPYGCAHCDAKFTQKHGMMAHVKYIHMKGKRRAF